jgi:CRISPR type III-A-associated RAMP protein Csm4
MNPGTVVKLRPTGPWRSGPDSGARNQVDPVYHSDSVYSAVSWAMRALGRLEEWLNATARNPQGAAVRFSSCFPFHEETGYVIPPRNVWPPAGGAPVTSTKVRWKAARYIPLRLVDALLSGQALEENHWTVDGPSDCLVPAGRPGPFRTAVRSGAAVDRLSGNMERYATACTEFLPGAGLWALISFADEEQKSRWSDPVRAAFRLLADSGFGGERSRGWGRAEDPEFIEGVLPDMILPPRAAPAPALPQVAPQAAEDPLASAEPAAPAPEPQPRSETVEPAAPAALSHWLLSLFTPDPGDAIDWKRGNYAVMARSGRVDSPSRHGELKKQLNMVAEGSVLVGGESLRGAARDVAPDGFPHPVYRAGFALAIPLPPQVTA